MPAKSAGEGLLARSLVAPVVSSANQAAGKCLAHPCCKPLIYMVFIFVELEINVWITIHRCRAVADY